MEFPLNRTYFFEQLIMAIKHLLVNTQKYANISKAYEFVLTNIFENFVANKDEIHKTLT